mmetsp:Transcript_16085/g.51984  ORF Transcript_16085/g.51984 Transcript_16085/m.51984 type:complete len:392 (-) Transcript_16085:454-1629(-)
MKVAVVHHWGKAKIGGAAASLSDEALLAALAPKLDATAGASHARLAAEALAVGRRGLAARLLEKEEDATRRVPLLLQMGEERLALTSAVAHGDAELIYLLLLHLKARLPSALFFGLLQPHPAAQRLLIHFCRQQDTKTLREFLYHADQPLEAASLAAAEGYRAETLSQRTRGLALARQFYEVAAARAPLGVAASLSFSPAGDTGASHHAALMAHATGEQLRLLTAQLTLEQETAGAPPPPAGACCGMYTPERSPVSSRSYSARQRRKPSFGLTIGRRPVARASASERGVLRSRIRKARTSEAERETPREQWTKTAPPRASASAMKSRALSKCSLMSAAATSRTAHQRCLTPASRTAALSDAGGSASAVIAWVTPRCSLSRGSATASSMSPR